MSRHEETSGHRALWLMLVGAVVTGLFAFWFVRGRNS
jgi:LPXTG-motif cell wall-anchored protein